MKHIGIAVALFCGFTAGASQAADLSPEVTAKFLKVIATTSGQTRVGCNDSAVKAALEAQGMPVDSGSAVVWCSSLSEARMQTRQGKLVVVGHRELGATACIILVEEEGGRPKLILNTGNIRNTHLTLGDALMKIGEKL